jgi:hypothetical protein
MTAGTLLPKQVAQQLSFEGFQGASGDVAAGSAAAAAACVCRGTCDAGHSQAAGEVVHCIFAGRYLQMIIQPLEGPGLVGMQC